MNFALLFCCIIGIFLSFILLFYNKGYKTANKYLGGFFFFISLFILSQYSGLYGNSEVFVAVFASAPTPFVFLIGPLSYLYIRSVLKDDSTLKKRDALHFILFLLEFAGMVPYYLSSWENKLSVARTILSDDWHVTHLSLNVIFVSPINSYLRPLHILFYLVFDFSLLRLYYNRSKKGLVPANQAQIVKKWLLAFMTVFAFFLIVYCLVTLNLLKFSTRHEFQANSPVLMFTGSLALVLLNIIPFLFPQILYGLPRIIALTDPPLVGPSTDAIIENTNSPEKEEAETDSKLSQGIGEKLASLFNTSQPWTKKNFSIASLAIQLNIPEHHLRYYFNHELKQSFSEYRNHLRVNHVKHLLQSGQSDHLSMEGIGAMAGFPSKSTFFSVFKKETGMTPKEYLDKLQ